ncbi:MAG: hypothetical protein CVU15_07675 [Betaproteobacteria bacterium HGW-Betaproteobacteria-1]|jgi:class 3 adenylate cyclase|nr:MAG: hypothetical protein CVU15_07675 [Betaproteobacteria bacterium HGW-Betaproteobacteria-1]
MNERLNKTSICTVIFLDIVGYTKCTDAEQIAQKKQFNRLINEAIKSVAQNDRILLDTGDGAAIALLGAPEEALFIAMTIRDGIDALNKKATENLLVRIGINLGPVRVVKDINGRPNIIGDGINVAQRVMSFAEPNQILVSRSYYEITSRLSKEITELFTYSGVKQDKHVREHEVYSIGATHQAGMMASNLADDGNASELHSMAMRAAGKRWWPVAAVLVVLIALTVALANGLFVSDGTIEVVAEQAAPDVSITPEATGQQALEPEVLVPKTLVKEKPTQNKPAQPKPKPQPRQGNEEQTISSAKTTNGSAESGDAQQAEHLTWESFKESVKQGSTKKVYCSDVERSLKQCE